MKRQACVFDPGLHKGQRGFKIESAITFQIGIHHMHVTLFNQSIYLSQRILAFTVRTKAVAVLGEVLLENRLNHIPQRRLHDPATRVPACSTVSVILAAAQISLLHVLDLPVVPSPTIQRRTVASACFRTTVLPDRKLFDHPLRDHASLRLCRSLADLPQRRTESSSSSYGPTVHLQLLPTPPRDDAVTFGYEIQTKS